MALFLALKPVLGEIDGDLGRLALVVGATGEIPAAHRGAEDPKGISAHIVVSIGRRHVGEIEGPGIAAATTSAVGREPLDPVQPKPIGRRRRRAVGMAPQ